MARRMSINDQRRLDDARKWGRENLPTNDLHKAELLPIDSTFVVLDNTQLETDAKPRQISISGIYASMEAGGLLPSGGVEGVQLVNTASGILGGPITSAGTIFLDTTGVVPGDYPLATITVDEFGRVTAAASGAETASGVVTFNGRSGAVNLIYEDVEPFLPPSGLYEEQFLVVDAAPGSPSGVVLGGLNDFGLVDIQASFSNPSGTTQITTQAVSNGTTAKITTELIGHGQPGGVGAVDVVASGTDIVVLFETLNSETSRATVKFTKYRSFS